MKKHFSKIALFLWAVTGLLVMTLIHSWHYVNLQDPSVLKLVSVEDNKWGVYHFFDPHCSCSQAIIDNLSKRKPLNNKIISEKIFYHKNLGLYEETLKAKGYDLIKTDFKENGITGVPLLLIFDQNKTAQYIGGYSDRPVNGLFPPDERDLVVSVLRGKKVKNLPVIGCSVSQKYQTLLDPLGLKYATSD